MAAGNMASDAFVEAQLMEARLKWPEGANGRKARHEIVERAYIPMWSSWIVAKSRAALDVFFGAKGTVSLTWNCVGATTEYKFNSCGKVTYECVPAKGIVAVCWENIPQMEIERSGLGIHPNLKFELTVHNVPKVVVWLPIDCLGDWWQQYADKPNLPGTLSFKKSAGDPVPRRQPFKHPNAQEPKPKAKKLEKVATNRRAKSQASQSMDF
jgi:hypothetical protein